MSLIKSLKISWLSPQRIDYLSFGNISNSKVVNLRTLKPEEGGIFDPRIFGPFSNYECRCGNLKGKQYEGQVCDALIAGQKCGTLVAEKNIQRWRGGDITLVSPITNLTIFKILVPNLSSVLGISAKTLEDIVYFRVYIVLDNGSVNRLKKKQTLKKKIDSELISNLLQEIIADEKLDKEVITKARELNRNLGKKKKQKDYYKILGVKKSANQNEIKKAYQKLILKYPKNKEKTEEKLKEINEAYAILGDKKKRESYTDSEIDNVFLEDYLEFLKEHRQVKIETGTEAFRELLREIDANIGKKIKELKNATSDDLQQTSNEDLKFLQACQKNGLKLEWMIVDRLPVIPCGLRPIVNLKEKNTVTMAQIDKLHHKILLTNERLKDYIETNEKLGVFPIDIIHNQKVRLQKAVDQLIYGLPHHQSEIKSLLQSLSGKEGILRHYSLGKRVDYSARSVIIPNPSLRLDQIGIPVKMALTLYKPFIIQKILKEKIAFTVREAEQMLLNKDPIIFSFLDKIVQNHPVLANRAPSLHRLSMQGFYPQLTPHNSIELHPLVTAALNADFDGDQIAIHLPLTEKSCEEVEKRVLSTYHIIDPKNGHLITTLNQDMILGLYYLTKESKGKEIKFYDEIGNIWKSHEQGKIGLHELVLIPAFLAGRNFATAKNQFLFTTLGKLIFNQSLPPSFPFYLNDLKVYNSEEENNGGLMEPDQVKKEWKNYQPQGGWKKKDIFTFLNKITRITPREEMIEFLDKLKQIGFNYATYSGISISPFELEGVIAKEKQLVQSEAKIKQIDNYYSQGFYDEAEKRQKKITVWEECKDELQKQLVDNLEKRNSTSFYHIWDSGARASSENLTQLFAMRGHATNYLGEVIETPIISSLWEGLSPFEFFISVYGAVKGMIDIALKTAQAGDLTRRLVESSQSLTITSNDCQTSQGILIEEEDIPSLCEGIYGRYLARDIFNQKKEIILTRDTFLLEAELKKIVENKISSVWVRSPLNCELVEAICQKCYGLDLSRPGETISLGEAIGIIAAQSLGEPGTQLTMRTFHTGGITGDEDITQGLPKVKQIFDVIKPLKEEKATIAKEEIEIISAEGGEIKYKNREEEEKDYQIGEKTSPRVNRGDKVQKGVKLTTGKIDLEEYLEIMGRETCQNYIKKEIKKVYSNQGIDINEKHIEIFARQMLSRVEITDSGGSDYLVGDIVNYQQIQKINQALAEQKKKPTSFKNIISSLKYLASYPNSFLSGISFQNTLKSLIHYSLYQPTDYLRGCKESLIAGQLIPVGTGFKEREKYSKGLAQRRRKIEE